MNAPLESPPPPSSRRTGWLLLCCLCAIFAADVAHFTHQLPDRVATHFGASGKPNGWMDRLQFRNFTLAIGIGTPLVVATILTLTQRMGGAGLNIPHKEYWLAPERQRATGDFLARHGLWLAALLVLLHSVLFHQIVSANRHAPIVLPTSHSLITIGAFLTAVAAWVIVMIRRFRKPAA